MKVLVINGSPHIKGCTDRGLREIEDMLNANGIDTERGLFTNFHTEG